MASRPRREFSVALPVGRRLPSDMGDSSDEMLTRARQALESFGATDDLLKKRNLPQFEDAIELEIAHVSASGREHLLVPEAARQWRALRQAADDEGVTVLIISGFRSFDRQVELIYAKLHQGERLDDILAVMAPPGCSEHHCGRAVDVGTPGCEPLSETFEDTDAFQWLRRRADEFDFQLSYPRGNPMGFQYEPWHWCYQPSSG
jgi:zinc D-Ala-D-Ala carboxypeptidase